MKSKNAKAYIDEALQDAACFIDADGVGMNVIRKREAIHAVELAEEEAEERIRAELSQRCDTKEGLTKEQEIAIRKIAVEAANIIWRSGDDVITDDILSTANRICDYIMGKYHNPTPSYQHIGTSGTVTQTVK